MRRGIEERLCLLPTNTPPFPRPPPPLFGDCRLLEPGLARALFSSRAPQGGPSPSAAPGDSSVGIKGGLPPPASVPDAQPAAARPRGADFIPARLSRRGVGWGAGRGGVGAGSGRLRPRPRASEPPGPARVYYTAATGKG